MQAIMARFYTGTAGEARVEIRNLHDAYSVIDRKVREDDKRKYPAEWARYEASPQASTAADAADMARQLEEMRAELELLRSEPKRGPGRTPRDSRPTADDFAARDAAIGG
jgi:hypothetical protein